MHTVLIKRFSLMLVFCMLSLPGVVHAQADVPLQFAPPIAPEAWDTRQAETVGLAMQVSLAQMDMGEAEVDAWVARVAGDPPPAGLYDDMDWRYPVLSAYVIELDLEESLRATVEMMGETFETQLGPGWTTRALALADKAAARTVVRQEYVLAPQDGSSSLGVNVISPFVDLTRLEILEGTWVQIVRIRGADF